ncbi:MAG: hypothetical protein Q8K89_12790 [Actinomycetota bacterium]|nr:hypothetical protein [Actinomycetota bacterium]
MAEAGFALDKLHYIHTKNGCFSKDTLTSADDIDAMLDEFFSNPPDSGLVIHFHGGLVPLSQGAKMGSSLTKTYGDGNAFPVFFAWESGALETVVNNLRDISNEKIFRELLRKALEYALKRVGVGMVVQGFSRSAIQPDEVTTQVDKWFSQELASPPFDDLDMLDAQPTHTFTYKGLSLLEDDAADDAALLEEIKLDAAADERLHKALDELRDGLADRAVSQHSAVFATKGPIVTLMDPEAIAGLVGPTTDKVHFGLLEPITVALTLFKLTKRVLGRLSSGRDHGVFTTTMEEIYRQLYVGAVGQALLWNQMKKDTADAFSHKVQPDCEPGGTMFLQKLEARLKDGDLIPRITLVGHSTGAIYICNFLAAADAVLDQNVKFDVVLLAPAVGFAQFSETMRKHSSRLNSPGIRSFGMSDELELKDVMARGFLGAALGRLAYPRSLLYFVSGLLEDEADLPLLGMQRFFDNEETYDAHGFPDVVWGRKFLANSTVWSEADQGPGRCTEAHQHGAFDEDEATLGSLVDILRNGL